MRGERWARGLRRLRAAASNAGLVLGSLGIAVILAEGVVRLAAPQQLILIRPDLWQPADTVGWLHRPNVRTRINTGERTVSVLTDAEGFRVGSELAIAEGARILLLGDSFVEALQVEYEESAAGLLEETLPDLVGRPVTIRNAGIGGWDPDQYLLRARALLARDEYDLLITGVYLGNDVISHRREYLAPRLPAERHRARIPRGLSRAELTDAILAPINDFLEVRSHLYLLLRNRLQTLRMRLDLAPLTFPPQFLRSEAAAPRWDVTADLLEEIHELAARRGVPALFVLIPAPFQVDSADLGRYVQGFDLDPTSIDLELPNRTLDEELSARGLRVYDPLEAFRSAHDGGQRLYGDVDPHFTPTGNALFAELVAPLAAGLLSSARQGAARPDGAVDGIDSERR